MTLTPVLRPTLTPRRAWFALACITTICTSWTGLVIGLALVGAPAALPVALGAVELTLATRIACELAGVIGVIRRADWWRHAIELAEVRRQLADLPETPHPLDRA